jgi:uncharacterized protein involved in exopolysaccharide biosynthesis
MLIIVITLVSVVAGVIMSLMPPETYFADALLNIGRKVTHSFTPPSLALQHIETPPNLVESIPRLYGLRNNESSGYDLEVKMMSGASLIKITIKGFDKKRVEESLKEIVNRIIDDHSRETEDSTQYLYALIEGLDKDLKKVQGERDQWESELNKMEEKINIEEVDPVMSMALSRRMFLQSNLDMTITNIRDANADIRRINEKLLLYKTFADSVKNYKTRLIGNICTTTMKPKRKRNILMAGAAGLLISLFLSLSIEYLRKENGRGKGEYP